MNKHSMSNYCKPSYFTRSLLNMSRKRLFFTKAVCPQDYNINYELLLIISQRTVISLILCLENLSSKCKRRSSCLMFTEIPMTMQKMHNFVKQNQYN